MASLIINPAGLGYPFFPFRGPDAMRHDCKETCVLSRAYARDNAVFNATVIASQPQGLAGHRGGHSSMALVFGFVRTAVVVTSAEAQTTLSLSCGLFLFECWVFGLLCPY